MIVYLAGPYSKGDVAQNVHRMLRVADYLANLGVMCYVPLLTHFWHLVYPREYEFWMKYDLLFLEKCDCLIRLKGESAGADREVDHAKRLKMPVHEFGEFDMQELNDLDAWISKQKTSHRR
jgi:hypothetical protein